MITSQRNQRCLHGLGLSDLESSDGLLKLNRQMNSEGFFAMNDEAATVLGLARCQVIRNSKSRWVFAASRGRLPLCRVRSGKGASASGSLTHGRHYAGDVDQLLREAAKVSQALTCPGESILCSADKL